jgi:translation initiation factor 2D
MFIKPFKVKNNIQVKGSEVKKLKTRLSQQYKTLTESDLSNVFPSKASCQTVKIVTHAEAQVTVYTVDKRPMFFELQDRLYPTVYTLWIVPSICFLFTTHPPVLPKLANGANLMMPGIVKEGGDLKSFGRFQKDQVVGVNLTSNRSAIAVGTLAKDSEDMYMSGGQGVCVNILHVFGDKLWGFEPTVTLQVPLSQPVLKAPSLNNTEDFPALGAEPPKKEEAPTVAAVQQQVENLAVDDGASETSDDEQPFNPDDALKKMFLSALKLQKKELSGLLPIIVAVFYPTYVLKQVQPNPDKPVTIKETSYKKVSTFIKKMADEGFVVVKEENKGVEKITSINYDHPELVSHIPLKPASDGSKAEPSSHLMLTKMTELFVVNEATKKMFNALGVAEGKSLDETQIKNYVKDYVARNKLLNPLTKEVTLDDILVEICVGQRENEAPILMPVTRVIAAVNSRMESTFEMRSQSGPTIKGGKKPIIQITTATRMGNKKVTLISNLEAYGINVAEFSKACKIGVQASTSITKVAGTNINQFQIQGNHVRFVYTLLTDTYQVAKSNITGLEYAKKDKGGKKK